MIINNIESLIVDDIYVLKPGSDFITNENDIIPIQYKINSKGFRSNEFKKNIDFLFLGCSFTEGLGLHDEKRWANILSKNLNVDFSILAQGGDSMMGQIIKCFWYFKNFGHPKNIIGMFPINRMPVPQIENKIISKTKAGMWNHHPDKIQSRIMSVDFDIGNFFKYAKSPYIAEDILPNELSFFYERAMLDMLEQYCLTNNINFFWTVWDYEYEYSYYEKIEKAVPGYHKNYYKINSFKWLKKNGIDLTPESDEILCHIDISNDFLFNEAADRKNKYPHWGWHRNIHIAEEFYNHIIKSSKN